jgi:1-Cys peroxiredoxin 6
LGDFTFHEFCDSDPNRPWTILFSHPADFTPVCTTELGRADTLLDYFSQRGVKMIGISCDSVSSHLDWIKDILAREGRPEQSDLSFPIIADEDKSIVTKLGMLDPLEKDAGGLAMPARALIVIDSEKKVKLSILYPATTGRNFNEVLRVIDSLQLTADLSLATPVDWQQGDRLIVAPSVKTEDANERFQGLEIENLPSGKEYFRTVEDPAAPAEGEPQQEAP